MFAVTLLAVVTFPEPSPREVAEAYVAAALAGKTDDAVKLAVPDKSPAKPATIERFRRLVGAPDRLPIPTVIASEGKGAAIAVSDPVRLAQPNPDGRDIGCVVLRMKKTAAGWRVDDLDFSYPEQAAKELKKVREVFPDAKEIPPAKK